MPPRKDLMGQQFGELTVTGYSHTETTSSGAKKAVWSVLCSCGVIKTVRAHELAQGKTISCGHVREAKWVGPLDLTCQRFGMLTVLEYAGRKTFKSGETRDMWRVRCDCGVERDMMQKNLMNGNSKTCGCTSKPRAVSIRRDLVGMKFGRLTVESFDHVIRGASGGEQYLWNVVCDCGVRKKVRGSTMTEGRAKSCGCYSREVAAERSQLPDGVAVQNRMFYHYKRNANLKGVPFELTWEQFFEIAKGDCDYCGAPPAKSWKVTKAKTEYIANGIDRVVPSLGYVWGNCLPACRKCNVWKNIDTPEEVESHAQNIVNQTAKKKAMRGNGSRYGREY